MIANQSYGGVSSQVKMRLIVNGTSIRITHMGPDFLFVDSPSDHPPCEAAICLQVDNHDRQWTVKLPDGVSSNSKRVALALSS